MPEINLSEVLSKIKPLIIEVGDYILEHKNDAQFENKAKNDLVTAIDKESERRLFNGLTKILPESGFIGEEQNSKSSENGYYWVVDPIDGTTNFIHGLPCFSISVALCKNEVPVLGLIYELNSKEYFSAAKNLGAFLNGEAIHVSKVKNVSNALVATGFPYRIFDKIESYVKLFTELMFQTHGIRRLGSAAVDLAYVACGRFDVFYEMHLNNYDVAAGIIIVEEAGGKVSDFYGENEHYNGRSIVASNNYIHHEFLKIIARFF